MMQWKKAFVGAGMLIVAGAVQADDPIRININISGTLVANGSCTFNQGDSVSVDFGDVEFATVEGSTQLKGEYVKPLPSDMDCKGDMSGASLTLKTAGSLIDYQGHKLLPVNLNGSAASQDLAIRLTVNGEVQDINTSFTFDTVNQPSLQAELVQTGTGAGFSNGAAITASATLVMEFL